MIMNYFEIYKDRLNIRGVGWANRMTKLQEREFELFFRDSPNKYDCLINGERAKLIFQDHSQSNNKDLSDDKYVIAKNSTKVAVGDYITWNDSEWLVFTEEYKTIRTHQQLKVKNVNETMKWIRNGEIINDGKGWGAYVQSQTLYTMGVSKNTNLHVVDSKMSLYMQNNEDTRSLQMGERVIVGRRAYKLNFIDDVSRKGLISFLLDEDTLSEDDNVDLGVANYGKYFGNKEIERPAVEETNKDKDTEGYAIVGNDRVRLSGTYTYQAQGFVVRGWMIESLLNDDPAIVQSQSGESITLHFKDDYRFIGKKINLVAIDSDDNKVSLPITIIKKF